jgi:hypothetical protein
MRRLTAQRLVGVDDVTCLHIRPGLHGCSPFADSVAHSRLVCPAVPVVSCCGLDPGLAGRRGIRGLGNHDVAYARLHMGLGFHGCSPVFEFCAFPGCVSRHSFRTKAAEVPIFRRLIHPQTAGLHVGLGFHGCSPFLDFDLVSALLLLLVLQCNSHASLNARLGLHGCSPFFGLCALPGCVSRNSL